VKYDEVTLPLHKGDVLVFCSDGIFEAMNSAGQEFGARRVCEIVRDNREASARTIVDAIFDAVTSFQGDESRLDDMTAVAVRMA